jgi:hypothetical protein
MLQQMAYPLMQDIVKFQLQVLDVAASCYSADDAPESYFIPCPSLHICINLS